MPDNKKKFIFGFAAIVSVFTVIFSFFPLLRSPISTIGWSSILIVSVPGVLALIATVTAIYQRIAGSVMFYILAAIFAYSILSGALDKNYWTLAGLYFASGLFFILSKKKVDHAENLKRTLPDYQ